ncbi:MULTISPECIES: pilus assembly protein [unclassified Ectothiorhodospira]|uniref:pilus assembly protein n=1 Tax=unclassified Ectothiorhodospira TaxID=2684909 RepID=UPI001EE9167F|nr:MULTISPECIES: PilC/PilY family type IV pilus protein [unclassified Ectothiorhodospira]MCG5517019.1 hypothetical protein [Ectothiorhodospira sp. 9100]MCG5520023.1 hypothetical protein [Ectothiorhodospira sp. 9905]
MFDPQHTMLSFHILKYSLLSFLLVIFAGGASPVQAGTVIADTPLFLVPEVKPALVLAVDNSGSMDSEILARTNDGAMWWNTNRNSFTGLDVNDQVEPGRLNFNRAGGASSTWKKFVYLFPNGTGLTSGRRAYGDSSNDHFAVPPIGSFAYARSPNHNASYFNPNNTYEPWPSLGNYTFLDSSPSEAATDPTRGSETFDLTRTQEQHGNNYVFKMYEGMTIPAGTRYRDWNANQWIEAANDVTVDQGRNVAISFFPATFFLPVDQPLPDDFGYLPDKGNVDGDLGQDAVVDGSAPDGGQMVRYEIKPENFVDNASYDAAIQNFANWFTYYRKRHIATRGAIGEAFEDIDNLRVGAYLINNRPNPATNLLIRDLSVGTDRAEFFAEIYHDFIGTGGTPNREAVNHMRTQFARTDTNAPVQLECQMNFGLLFTDGYANTWTGAGVNNKDGNMGDPFADTVSNTMADIAMALYLDNPRPDLPEGRVPVPVGCSAADPHPSLDCNTDLHVNLFGLTMGSLGTIFKVDEEATNDPFSHTPNWPTSFTNRNPVHVDDLWHATINSRGLLVDVEVPSELGERFAEILNAIAARIESSATSAAASSAVLQTDTLLYTAGFRSSDWSGALTAREVRSDGTLSDLSCLTCWDAEEKLATRTAPRKIFTRQADGSGTGSGVALAWDDLHASQQAAMDQNLSNVDDGRGADRLNWLIGNEVAGMRSRSETGTIRLLGDIVHSDPQFKNDVLYLGANDGMLHAFDSITGEELFAYIPSELLRAESGQTHAPINRLMDPDYNHRYFVDGTPALADVSIAGSPRTVLVGTMGAGGRTVFALDVTNPESFSASNILWEFSHPELGYRASRPAIVRLSDDTWAAVFGNGYDSSMQRAQLFVVNLETGALIQTIDTEIGSASAPNGLAEPFVTDWPDRDLRANRAYAGDLEGNLWVFDLSSTNPSDWAEPSRRRVLIQATDGTKPQPITSRPHGARIVDDPGRAMIVFGTGSYFRGGDNGDNQVQSLYGVFDEEPPPSLAADRANDLLQQEIVSQTTDNGKTVRVLSDNPINPTTHRGWYIDLDMEAGERVITGPRVIGRSPQRARFSTLVPDEDPCGSGRRGFFLDFNILTGGRTLESVIDLDGDEVIDNDDRVSGEVVSGIEFGQGERIITIDLPPNPASAVPGEVDQFAITGEGDIAGVAGDDWVTGRQFWQQLR